MQIEPGKPYELKESIGRFLGIKLVEMKDGHVKATMPVNDNTARPCTPVDILNGGASLAFAEIVSGYGSIHLCAEDEEPVGIQVSANHVSMTPIGEGRYVEAHANIVHRGRTQHVWNVDIITPEGKLVSTARVVNLIIKKRP